MIATTSSNIRHIALEVQESGGGSSTPLQPQAMAIDSPGPTSPVFRGQADNWDAAPVPQDSPGPGSPDLDFDDNANALWRLYETQTRSPDRAHIYSLKDDMERVLTFTGLFAVVLTALIIEGKKGLKVDPQEEMVYYLKQNVAMLDQISRQVSSIAPQFSIPSTPPAPFPDFKPSESDIRVNVYWFMALVFSLSAAFLATLVQQSLRDYMDAFQRYSDPLTSARLRQYLYEGLKRWCIPTVEIITGILHVSLFLFFMGLCDFVFNINTTIGITTTIPIGLTGLVYIFATAAQPILSPRLPYRTSFSSIFWYLFRILYVRRYKNWGPDDPVIIQRQTQHAMARKEGRMRRDARAIRRLVSSMIDDAEIESLVMAIPGSFSDGWGLMVWKDVLSLEEHTMRGLSGRVEHLLDTCKNPSLFAPNELWRRRTRACVEATALLVCGMGAKLGQFGDMLKLLGDIGKDQDVRGSSLEGKVDLFVMCWTCLSLVAIRPALELSWQLQNDASQALRWPELIAKGQTQTEEQTRTEEQPRTAEEQSRTEEQTRTEEQQQKTRVQKMSETFVKATNCLKELSDQLTWAEDRRTNAQAIATLHKLGPRIFELEDIVINEELRLDESSISSVQQSIDQLTHGVITYQLPGVKSDISESNDIRQFVESFRDSHSLLFIFPVRNLRRLRSFTQTVRNILEGHDLSALQNLRETIKDLREIQFPRQLDILFRRQMWRLQDLQDGGGLGFTVELFFSALKQLLSRPSSKESHSAFYLGTFNAITSNWRNYKHSPGTQALLVNMVAPNHGIIFDFDFPDYIVDEFLVFIGQILDGQKGPHIDDIVQQLTECPPYLPRYALSDKVLNTIRRSQASSS